MRTAERGCRRRLAARRQDDYLQELGSDGPCAFRLASCNGHGARMRNSAREREETSGDDGLRVGLEVKAETEEDGMAEVWAEPRA